MLLNKNRTKTGFSINLRLIICHNFRDEQLIRSLVGYLGCGRHSSGSKQDPVYFFVTKLPEIYEKSSRYSINIQFKERRL